ncbi:MAG: tetratricopeptide repeat protein [Chitinophagales bacterium]|nr:tetratricopeptide repeat protein [Chitinophagales bacterium]
MKLKWIIISYVLVCLAVLNYSCSGIKNTSTTSKSGSSIPKDEHDPQKLKAEEKLIEAKKMDILGDQQQALNLYKECIKFDPANDAAFYNAAVILFNQKQYPEALALMTQAIKINPENEWYLDLYGTLLGGTGYYKEAIRVYQQMTQQNPDNADAWFNLAFFLDQNKQTEEAINVFNQIEDLFGINEEITSEKVKLWMKEGKVDKAAAELQKLIEANGEDPRYYSRMVDFYMSNGMEDKAYEALQQMIKIDSLNPRANLVLAEYFRKKGEEEKSFEALQKAFSSADLDVNIKVPLLASFLPLMQTDLKKKAEAVALGQSLVTVHPNDAKVHALYGDILYQNDQAQEALDQYKQSLSLDNSSFPVWQQVMFLYDRSRDYDSLLAVSNKAIELFPDQNMAFYFNGYANIQLKKYKNAVASLGQAVAIGSEDKQFISQLYSSMGDAYYNLKNNSASDSCYDLALMFDPQNAYVLNNYSYYLSLRGEKLEVARKMAEQATSVAPNTSAYEDTYGWVLYKLGNYEEAKNWISKAIQNGADEDGTVLEHYGDVLYRIGDVNGAVQYWMRAKEKNVESLTIEKKIAERKLYD